MAINVTWAATQVSESLVLISLSFGKRLVCFATCERVGARRAKHLVCPSNSLSHHLTMGSLLVPDCVRNPIDTKGLHFSCKLNGAL